VLLYAPQSRPIQEELWQKNQRLVRTRLAGVRPQKTATIAAPVAKVLATRSSLTAIVAIPVVLETSKELSIPRKFKGRSAPLLVYAARCVSCCFV
jgi:butyrate kinase